MNVGMYYNNNDVRLEQMPKPEISSDELLVKVFASGICGSDIMQWYRIKKAPLVLGHEITGKIAEVGANIKKYKKGDRVFVSHHVPCNKCHYCANDNHTCCETLRATNYFPGGFSEYIRVPKINIDCGVFILPDSVSYDEGAMIEPLGCVLRAQKKINLKSGQSILIIGSGISGVLNLITAKAIGCAPVIMTDVNDYRIKAAKKFGADGVLNAKQDIIREVKKLNNGRLADIVMLCAGADSAFNQALESVDIGGSILLFAPTAPNKEFSIDINRLWSNGVKIIPSYGAAPDNILAAIELINSGKINVSKLITHTLPLSGIQKGFKLASEAKECIKVIIKPNKE